MMRRFRRLKEPGVQLAAAGCLALMAAAFAFFSYQSWQSWREIHRQLAPFVNRPVSAAGKRLLPETGGDLQEAVGGLSARYGVSLLSQHQSGREKDVQTLVLEGEFTALLSFMNDVSGLFPQRPCRLIQLERSDAGCVLTLEL